MPCSDEEVEDFEEVPVPKKKVIVKKTTSKKAAVKSKKVAKPKTPKAPKPIKPPKISKPKTQIIYANSKKPKTPKIKNPRKTIPKKPKIKKGTVQVVTTLVTPGKIPKIRTLDTQDIFSYFDDGTYVKKDGSVWKNEKQIARFGSASMAVIAITSKKEEVKTPAKKRKAAQK